MDDCTIRSNRRSKDRSSRRDLSIAQWVVDHGKRAGLGSDTLPAAPALYVPLSDERQRLGVLAVLPENRRRILLPGAAGPAGDLRGTTRIGDGACATGRAGGGGARDGRDREPAQHAARLDLARPAHTARSDRRCEQHTRRACRRSRLRVAHDTRAVHRDQGARHVGAGVERARPDALRVRDRSLCAATGTRSTT